MECELRRLGHTFSESVTVRTVDDSTVQGAAECRATIGAGIGLAARAANGGRPWGDGLS